MNICDICSCETDEIYIVNDGFLSCQEMCYSCYCEQLGNGTITGCECCGEVFSPLHLEINLSSGENEICPYCGEIWCE